MTKKRHHARVAVTLLLSGPFDPSRVKELLKKTDYGPLQVERVVDLVDLGELEQEFDGQTTRQLRAYARILTHDKPNRLVAPKGNLGHDFHLEIVQALLEARAERD